MKRWSQSDHLFKKSVASVYETQTFTSLLKDILHPGGLDLTNRIAEIAHARPGIRVLDIACGKGTGCFLFAEKYGCIVAGIDISEKKIVSARSAAHSKAFKDQTTFIVSDAEHLPFFDAHFDLVISECSFSILPNKNQAAREIGRVLKHGGDVVITDIVYRRDPQPETEYGLQCGAEAPLFSCLFGARPLEGYIEIFKQIGFREMSVEDHTIALKKIGYQMAMTYGDWENFLCRLSEEKSTRTHGNKDGQRASCNLGWYRNILSKAKLGYALIMMTKVC